MPYEIKRLSKASKYYKVINKDTGKIHSKKTTLDKAKAQVRLLGMILPFDKGERN